MKFINKNAYIMVSLSSVAVIHVNISTSQFHLGQLKNACPGAF